MGLVSSPLGIFRVIPARKSFLNHCIDQYWPSLIGQDGGYWTSLFYGLSPPLNPPRPSHRKKWPIHPVMLNEQASSKTHITLWEVEFVPVYEGTYMPECSGKQHTLNTYFVKHVSHRESQSEPDAFSTNVSATQEIKSSLKRSASSDNDKSKYVNRQTEIWAREAQCWWTA